MSATVCPAPVAPASKDDLSDEAWRVIDQLVRTGKATLADGSDFAPPARDLVGLLRWVASLKRRTQQLVPLPEDFQPGGSHDGRGILQREQSSTSGEATRQDEGSADAAGGSGVA